MVAEMSTETPDSDSLEYRMVPEIRREIADMAGIETDRYGNLDDPHCLRKAHVQEIARVLAPTDTEVEIGELTLAELYRVVCRWAGGEYQPTAGNQWRINRVNLKRIHRALRERTD